MAILSPRGQLLHVAGAAARIGIGYDALCRVIAAGGIAVLRHDSGRLRGIYERDCDEWVEAHRCAANGDRQEPSRQATRDVDRDVDALLAPDERLFSDA